MADLLVRNISEGLKQEIEQRARRNRRNLSEETKALIRGGLAISAKPIKMGTFLFSLLEDKYRGDDLVFERNDLVSPPPDFE
jgi:plasmid stability protein